PFDEQLLIAREHSDLSLRVSAAGGAIWLEPSAVVMYPWPKRNTIADARLNLVRWSDEWSERSYRRFNEMWGLTDVSIDDIYRQGHHQRQLRRRPPTGRRVRARFARALYRAQRALIAIAAALAVWSCDRRRARRRRARVLHAGSWELSPELTRVAKPDRTAQTRVSGGANPR
ncbi:MAG TPA: hypothetical protein VK549_00645, partial [Acidimicrobiia bacterium]|nr:hypothetical protein [Acidimicrobiia bacterium]